MSVINCSNLAKQYKTKLAINNLSLSIDENKIVGLIGRNGAGKTTFLKMCAGYLRPTGGQLKILNEEVFDNINVLSELIFVDEEIKYHRTYRIKDIFELAQIYYKNWDAKFANKLLKYFNLDENQKYRRLSRGMKTQLNMIVGLASRAPVTILDEPTLGMDAAVRKDFYNILLKDYMDNPRTIVISSHLLNEIESLLEEIILIDNGELVLHKPIEEMQEYAVYLSGKKDVVEPYIRNKQVLNSEYMGNSLIAAIKNDLTDKEKEELLNKDIDISKVKVEDVCIYLTKKQRGGVFDDAE